MTKEEYFNRNKKEIDVIAPSLAFGAKSAWNMFNLKNNDIKQKLFENGVKSIEQFNDDVDAEKEIESNEKFKKEIEQYKSKELEVLREYNAFTSTLEDMPSRAMSNLVYGGAKYFLDPIELGKTVALTYATSGAFAALGFTGKVAAFSQWGLNVLVDTIDNYKTNQWEDKLLDIDYGLTTDEQWIQAAGGALIGNSMVPMVKLGGKVIKGVGANFIDGFNSKAIEKLRGTMGDVDVIDLSSPDPIKTLKNNAYFKKITQEPTITGTFGGNLKREIADKELRLETGYTPSAVNMRELKTRVSTVIDTMQSQVKEMTSQGKEYDLNKISTHSDRNGQEIVNDLFAKPIEITEHMYKNDLKKRFRALTTKYDDTLLNLTSWSKNVNEKFSMDLEEGTVADSLIFTSFGINTPYLAKEGSGLSPKKLGKFAIDQTREFRDAIATGVTYITKENDDLFRTHPKYSGYFINNTSYGDFDTTVAKACQDYVNGKITRKEMKTVLFYQREQFKTFKGMGQAKGKFVTMVNKKMTTLINALEGVPEEEVEKLKKFARIESLGPKLDEIKDKKTNIAIMSLAFNKKKALDFFSNVKDYAERVEFLGDDRIGNIIVHEGETQEQALNRVVDELFSSTRKVKAIAKDATDTYEDFGKDVSKDLIDIIKDNFGGSNTEEQMENFAYFMGLWKNDNISMLNTMEKITLGTKASMTSLGTPLYQIENIVNSGGGLMELAFNIPVLRKDFDSFVEMGKKNPAAYTQIESSIKKALKSFVDNNSVFEKPLQRDLGDVVTDAAMYVARNYFLSLSGIKETFSHPALVAVKSAGYFNHGLRESAMTTGKNLPKTLALGALRELKPIMQTTNATRKLYRGLGTLIGGEELAMLELARSFETISPLKKGAPMIEGAKGMARMVQNGMLHFQGSMQNIRYLASRFQGIDVIKKTLKESDYDLLPDNVKTILRTFYIKDQIAFDSWKREVNVVGLKNALYSNGKSDLTKYFHESMTHEFYSEDPLKKVKSPNIEQHFLNKVRTMFTTFTNDMLNYEADKIKYFKDENGVFQSRLTPDYLKHIKNNPLEPTRELGKGAAASTLLGLSIFGGLYLEGTVFQTSQDEEIEARILSVVDNGYNKGHYAAKLGADLMLQGTQLDAVLQGGNILKSLTQKAKRGEFLPTRIDSIYNYLKGTPKYKENPWGMDWYEKAKYNELVKKDKENRSQEIEMFEKAMTIASAEVLEEDGTITKEQALEIKRKNGIDDIKEAKTIQDAKNYKLLLNISLAQGGVNKDMSEFEEDLTRNINIAVEKDLLDANLDEVLKEFELTKKEAMMLNSRLELNSEQKRKLDDYMEQLEEPDHIQRMILKAKKTKELLSQ